MTYNDSIENDLYAFHKEFEGYSTCAYLDCVGNLTIGVGHANQITEPYDAHSVWSAAKVKAVWRKDVAQAIRYAQEWLPKETPEGLRIAVIDLVFNTGRKPMTLVEKATRHNYADALSEILRWTRAGGVVRLGLVRRRVAMYALAMGYDWIDIAKCPVKSTDLDKFNSVISKCGLKVEKQKGGLIIKRMNVLPKV